jgi:hypothetical protein
VALSDRPYGPNSNAASVANQIPLNQQATQTQSADGVLAVLFELVSTAETQAPSNNNPAAPLTITIPPSSQIEQTVFDLFASGYIKTTSTTNVTIKLYEGDTSTLADNTLLASSGAIAQNGTTEAPVVAAWWAHAQLIFDSISGTLAGKVDFYVNKTVVAAVTLTNFPTGFLNQPNPSANPPTVANLPDFTISFTSSGAAPGTPTTVNVQKFSVG